MKWQDVNWQSVQSRVSILQERIYSASQAGNKKQVQTLQTIVIRSLDAKLLAVRRVTTENSGKNTPHVDSYVATTPEQKIKMVQQLKVDGKALSTRQVLIPKSGKTEKQQQGIPMIHDRAKQALVKLALEPEWEAKFEPNSFGFRPGRSCHDAIESVFRSTCSTGNSDTDSPVYILEADLKGCFNNISHDHILQTLDTTPVIANQVKAWLQAGIVTGFPATQDFSFVHRNELDIPSDGVISPFLSNVALHGMESHLATWIRQQTMQFPPGSPHWNYSTNKVKELTLVRYADDFVVIHKEKRIIELAKAELAALFERTHCVRFNDEKTKITLSTEGIKFLGFSIIHVYRQRKLRVKIYPTVEAQGRLRQKVTDICLSMRTATAYQLIERLRPCLIGWANYYQKCECADVFANVDFSIYQVLRKWAFRRDKRSPSTVVKDKYFPQQGEYTYLGKKHKNNWVLVGDTKHKVTGEKVTNFLPKLSWVPSIKHIPVKGSSSVFDGDALYWLARNKNFGLAAGSKKLFIKQKGICPFCKSPLDAHAVLEDNIVARATGGKDTYNNLQLLHTHCHTQKTQLDIKTLKKIQEPDEGKLSSPGLSTGLPT